MKEKMLFWLIQIIVLFCLSDGQQPGFNPRSQSPGSPPRMHSREKFTNKTIDQIITEALGGIDLAANKIISPGENILAELDMMLTQDQFISLYELPYSDIQIGNNSSASPRRTKRKAIRDPVLRWTNNEMPYTFANGHFTDEEIYMIKQSMTEWERYTCIKFRPANSRDRNVVHFQNGEGCNSQLGMVGGVQLLNLEAPGCRFRGLYLHEIGHALGLVHEHQLPNRDEYIDILYENVAPQMRVWFNKYAGDKVNQFNNRVLYEYSSVMHYGITAFAYDGKSQTIRAKDATREEEIGRVYLKELSFSDIKAVNLMYKCGAYCPKSVKCRNGGFVDQNCRCICPDGTSDCAEGSETPVPDDTTCINEYADWPCNVWAKQGECQRNEGYMSLNCRKACRLCGTKEKDEEENHFTTWAWQWFGIFTNLFPKDWIIGVCQDAFSAHKCGKWKENGECVTNKDWMSRNCKKTCNACDDNATKPETNCKNLHTEEEKCDTWALSGECQINPVWMTQNCRQSCHACDSTTETTDSPDTGGGSSKCEDQYDSSKCQGWANTGECEKNPTWMIPNCRKSCEKCVDGVCKNVYDDTQCRIWASEGECLKNPQWMKNNCAVSCKACKPGTDNGGTDNGGTDNGGTDNGGTDQGNNGGSSCNNNHNDVECDIWAKYGHCDINPEWMLKNCQKACKVCSETDNSDGEDNKPDDSCYDLDSGCAGWARHGFCETNPRYNLIYCRHACKNCNGCRDTQLLCPVWSKAGHCTQNARYMLRECQKSCRVCEK